MTALLVALGAALGAPLRYAVDRFLQSRIDSVFPWGTLVVNVAGSFAMGVLLGRAADGGVSPGIVSILGMGFCGALTTYSTFSYETLRLLEGGAWRHAVANVAVSVGAGVAAAAVGWNLA